MGGPLPLRGSGRVKASSPSIYSPKRASDPNVQRLCTRGCEDTLGLRRVGGQGEVARREAIEVVAFSELHGALLQLQT